MARPPVTLPVVTATVAPTAPIAVGPATVGPYLQGVLVQADPANVAAVFVGDSSVTIATGIELLPHASTWIACGDPSAIFCCAGVAGQKVRVLGLDLLEVTT